MAEGTFEHECMRAELLGMPEPDVQEWLENQKERLQHQAEEVEEKTIEELESQNDELNNVSGGLDELNSILSITQKKLNRFKNVCGSLTNLLKIKVGHSNGSTESIPKNNSEGEGEEKSEDESSGSQPVPPEEQKPNVMSVQNGGRKADMSKSMNNQVDKLDSLITKAETAQLRMVHQQKQMKKYLK